MHGRYEVADLLKLRQSPLVARPKALPPIEEWMGTIETKRPAASRGKFDEPSTTTDGFQKRPTLLDTASRRSTTDAGGIHLGPPRNSFASSNATRNRNGTHERTKTNEDLDTRFSDRRSGAFSGLNGKLGTRGDSETDAHERSRRRGEDDDTDARPRRDYDRPKWNSRDSQLDGEKSEDPNQRNNRDPYSREKFSQPWVRKEKPMDHDDNRKDNPAWRRGLRDRENERQDAEPEWVDSVEDPEPLKQHTHEDFLRWKESMTGRPTGDAKSAAVEDVSETKTAAQPRIVSDPIASGDKFFAKFEEKQGTGARPTKSRFANIFTPKEQPKIEVEENVSTLIPNPGPAELEQPPPPTPAETEKKGDADFAKLLAMLSKNESSSPAVKLRPPRSPVNIAELASARSPDITTAAPTQSARPPVVAHTHTSQLSLDRLIESRSPAHQEQAVLEKPGAQELLALLQRSNIQDRQEQRQPGFMPQEQRSGPLPPPGLSGYSERDRPGPPLISTRREGSRSIFDDPAFAGYRAEPPRYRPQQVSSPPEHGGIEGFFAAMNKGYPVNPPDARPPQNQAAPPGLQRPPGLDSRPPPGWTGNPPQPQRQPSQHMFNYNPGPQQNMFPNQNQPGYAQQPREPQRLPQRKPTGELPAFMNYPPPGFGPSPPYVSPTSPDQFASMRNEYGLPGGGIASRERLDRQPPPPPPQGQPPPNPFAAMYGNSSGGRGTGGGGGIQLPPGFR